MPFWRRDEPAHERLAREGGLVPERGSRDGRQRWYEELVGIHGVPRPREWDAVGTAEAPGLADDRFVFVVLPDSTLLVEEGRGGELDALAGAVEAQLDPPFRAEAVRREGDRFAVAAVAIEVVELEGMEGDSVVLSVQAGEKTLEIDGEETFGSLPALEELAGERFDAYALVAERLDGGLWEVRITPL